jgi:trans-aconitate 2-methyltransferase
MATEWDAPVYDRISDPQLRWGTRVLDRLELAGDERVLDAGCGTGRVTELLLDRLPAGTVVALDRSPAMLEEAGRRLARSRDRVELVVADLARPLPVGPVDAVLSTATLHWVPDHGAVFRHLAAVLRPGGRFVAQFGGAGNIASVAAAMGELGASTDWTFATPEETAGHLRAAGFVEVATWLQPEPTRLDPGEPLETFLATVILREALAGLPVAERPGFVRAVADRLAPPLGSPPGVQAVIDYVRLNLTARRGPGG